MYWFSLLSDTICIVNMAMCMSLCSHLPGWPWPGGVLLQLPALHFQVQVSWIPIQVTIVTIQYHCTDAQASFIQLSQQVFKHNMQAHEESQNHWSWHKITAVIAATVEIIQAKTGSIHFYYSFDLKTASRSVPLPLKPTQSQGCFSGRLIPCITFNKDFKFDLKCLWHFLV